MKRARPEDDLQRTVFEHLTTRGAPGIVAFHPPNGGGRSKTEAAILKGLGVVPGIPDVFVLQPGPPGFTKIIAIELKGPNGRLSPEQCNMLSALGFVGAVTHVCSNLDSALGVLEGCGALRGHAELRTLGDIVARRVPQPRSFSRRSTKRRGR